MPDCCFLKKYIVVGYEKLMGKEPEFMINTWVFIYLCYPTVMNNSISTFQIGIVSPKNKNIFPGKQIWYCYSLWKIDEKGTWIDDQHFRINLCHATVMKLGWIILLSLNKIGIVSEIQCKITFTSKQNWYCCWL